MRPLTTAALACVLAAARAQELSKVLDCTDAFTRLEAACEPAQVPKDWMARISAMLEAWQRSTAEAAGEKQAQRKRRRILQVANGNQLVLATGDKAFVEAAEGALQQLRRDEVLDHRLLCTLATLPPSVARVLEFEVGRAKAVDEAAAGDVLKAAIGARGTLVNLPEAKGLPLVPFLAEPARAKEPAAKDGAGKDGADKDERHGPRIACTALPVGANEAVLELRVDGGAAQTLRLAAGSGAIVRLPDDARGPAQLLWVRYAGTTPHVATRTPAKDR
ncbi:MAG: hypothetical protein U1E73_07040 [Planctomycetota bacterium]